MNTEPYSDALSDFLSFVRGCSEELRIADEEERIANDETQDILHSLELDKHTYHETAMLGKKLIEVRQKRRGAKDRAENVTPMVEWADANKAVIKALERVLGEMRKVEKRHDNRLYANRTNVLEESA